MEEINAANNIEALLKDHKNVTITTSYSHLAEGSDYTTTRQVRKATTSLTLRKKEPMQIIKK